MLYSAAVGKARVSFLEGTVLNVASIGLAWLLSRYVEKPLRAACDNFVPKLASAVRIKRPVSVRPWISNVAFVAVILAVMSAPVLGSHAWAENRDAHVIRTAMTSVKTDGAVYVGARAVTQGWDSVDAEAVPKNATLTSLFVDWGSGCKGSFPLVREKLESSCGYVKNASDDAPLIAVVGSSHALQKSDVIGEISKRVGANQLNLLETGCPYPFATPEGYLNERKKRCIAFSENATAEILAAKPSTVVLISTTTGKTAQDEVADPALDETLRQFTDAGIQVIGIRDKPRFAADMYLCATKSENPEDCSEPIEAKYGEDPAAPIFAKYADRGAYLIDLKDVYCPNGQCSVVQGNVYMYADSNHLTNVYEATLADIIYERAIAEGWNPKGFNAGMATE